MRFEPNYWNRVPTENQERFGPLLPFVGGLLVGGLFAPPKNGPVFGGQSQSYAPPPPAYYGQPVPYYPGQQPIYYYDPTMIYFNDFGPLPAQTQVAISGAETVYPTANPTGPFVS